MKYIALFESYDDEFTSLGRPADKDEYWDEYLSKLNSNIKKSQEESKRDYSDYYKPLDTNKVYELTKSRINFDNNEIEKVKLLFTNKYKVEESIWYGTPVTNYIKADNNTCEIIIFKLPDEYYLLGMGNDTRIYYLCDQFEGIVAFLNPILNPINWD